MNKVPPPGAPSDERSLGRLIKAIYRLVIDPSRLNEIERELADELDRTLAGQEDGPREGLAASLTSLEPHLRNATDLLNERGRKRQLDPGSSRYHDLFEGPVIGLDRTGLIVSSNEAARTLFGAHPGGYVTELLAGREDQKKLQLGLSRAVRGERGLVQVCRLNQPEADQRPVPFGLNAGPVGGDGALAILTLLRALWSEEGGRQFADIFSLTPPKIAVLRAIVTGEGLDQLAARRGRTLGTIRNQKRQLFEQTGVRSQVELACLFAGYVEHSSRPPEALADRPFEGEARRVVRYLKRAKGGTLEYELYGQENGRPVLWLHPLLGGTGLTEKLKEEVRRQNLLLIMPWRPFFGQTSEAGPRQEQLDRYAEDVLRLLDKLYVHTCPIVASGNSGPYAFALLNAAPHRFTQLRGYSLMLPHTRTGGLAAMRPPVRVIHALGAYAPRALRFFLRLVIAKFDAGFDIEFIVEKYAQSPSDKKTIETSKELQYMCRQTLIFGFAEGGEAVANEYEMVMSGWHGLIRPLGVPVELHYGFDDPRLPAEALDLFSSRYPFIDIVRHEGCGALVMFQLREPLLAGLHPG